MVPLTIPLLHFALAALLVSAAAGLSLLLAPNAPPRLKFWIAMLGLAAWLVPWPLVALPPLFAAPPPVTGWIGESARIVGELPHLSTPLAAVDAARIVPPGAWIALLAPGLVWFAFDFSVHRRTLRGWRRNSRDGSVLLPLLPSAFARRRLRIRVVAGSGSAAASGVLRPTLWIGERLEGEALRAALIHEGCHARSFDPLWLLFVRLVRRAYCWNPVVAVLARQAELWLEAACDRRCARLLGRRRYTETLARLMLSARPGAAAAVALLGARGQNVRRLQLLQRPVRVGSREWACLALCAATALGGVSFAAPQRDPRIGDWAEVGESAPDDEPILRSFEDLGGGLTRMKDDILPDGTAMSWSNHRCDGRDYAMRDRAGNATHRTISCRMLDPLTVEVTVSATDGSRSGWHAVDRVSTDGETYTSTITAIASGAEATSATRVFWRLH